MTQKMNEIQTFTAQQELFLEYLFNDSECLRDTKKACVAAGYDIAYHSYLVSKLQDEILDRANKELAMAAPNAVGKLISAMDEDGSTPKAAERLRAVESVLDRIGMAKKQQIEVTSESAVPLFILPEKKEVVIEHDGDNY
jgi:hypothetical protein